MTDPEWQPISSAPKDGRWFVTARFVDGEQPDFEIGCYDPLYWEKFVEVGEGLYRKDKEVAYEWRHFNNMHRATHWCDLPSHPPLKARP